MKVGEMFVNREETLYPSPDAILAMEIEKARRSYPNAGGLSDAHVLAFLAQTLEKNLAERTKERDEMRPMAFRK